MASEGVIVVGDSVEGYTERRIYVYWDINPDQTTERNCVIETPFYRIDDWRYATHEHIDHIYTTRWGLVVRAYQPITERTAYLNYKLIQVSNRYGYVYQDTRERHAFTEGLLTQTPLILKYPKYYNWKFIPQIINPEFNVWSYYDLDKDNITVKVLSDKGKQVILNSGTHKDKFVIEKVSKYVWKVKVYVDMVFEPGENVSVYVSMYDVKGNYLKPGLW